MKGMAKGRPAPSFKGLVHLSDFEECKLYLSKNFPDTHKFAHRRTWVAQLVECPTLGFSSGYGPRDPALCWDLHAVGSLHEGPLSSSPSARPPPPLVHVCPLSQTNKSLKNLHIRGGAWVVNWLSVFLLLRS